MPNPHCSQGIIFTIEAFIQFRHSICAYSINLPEDTGRIERVESEGKRTNARDDA